MRHRQAETGHDRITDELVQHTAFARDAIDHHREIVVEEGDGTLRTIFFGYGRETTNIGEHDGRFGRSAAEEIKPLPVEHLGRDDGIHIARHGGLHALFAADIFKHQHRSQRAFPFRREQRREGDIHRLADRPDGHARVGQGEAVMPAFGAIELIEDPATALAQNIHERLAHEIVFSRFPYP